MAILSFFFLVFLGTGKHECLCQPTQAQITTLSMTQELSGLAVKNMYIHLNSNLWIETENGLDAWDGLEFHQLKPPSIPTSSNPLRPENIANFGEDSEYIYLFYKSQNQLYDIYHKKSKTFTPKNYPVLKTPFVVQQTNTDKQRRPWIMYASTNRVSIISIDEKSHLKAEFDVSKLSTPHSFVPGRHGFWIIDSLYRVAFLSFDLQFKYFDSPTNLTPTAIDQISTALIEDDSGRLWYSVPGMSGLYRLTPGESKPYKIENLPEDLVIVGMWEDSFQRKLIALSSQRQIVRDHMIAEPNQAFKEWHALTDQSILPTKLISDDFHDLIFYGTHQGLDIIKFNERFIQSFVVRGGIPSDQYGHIITSLISISPNEVLASTENSETFSYNIPLDKTTFVENSKIQSTGQFATYCQGNKTLNSAHKTTNEHVNDIITLNLVTQQIHQSSIPIHIASVVEIPNNQLLFAGSDEFNLKLFTYNTETYEQQPLSLNNVPILAGSNISYMYFDQVDTSIYISTFDKGLLKCQWADNQITAVQRLNHGGLSDRNIISISRDNSGNLLVGSYHGLFILDSKTNEVIKHVTMKDGLSNNIVAAVLQDEKGFYWISTFAGLNVVDTRDYHVGNFHVQDGIPYNEFNRNAALKLSNGKLLFGTGNGFISIDPYLYHRDSSNFSIQFSKANIRSGGTDLHLDSIPQQPLILTVGKFSFIDIQIGNNDWGMTKDVTYHHRVAGLDDQWYRTKENQIRVDRLPEGVYQIEIKGLSRYGRWSDNVLTFPVEMWIPFFDRTWVRLLLLAIILSLFGLSYTYNNSQKLRQRLEFQKRVSNLELSLLQSQMNPHFIFNALGAIQFYIFNNQTKVAEEYLSKFAGLMRMFLESSRNKFITLKDEIKLLSGYMELEHMRFPNKFDSNIEIDLEDSTDSYQLPAMLIQPFLENSINHGIFHNKIHGEILVKFHEDEHALYCVIDDNGIGRTAAKELRAASISNHKSRSTQITEERIEVLKEAENMHITISYHDYEQKRDGRTGTRVEIKIPFVDSNTSR